MHPAVHLEPSETSKIELFAKGVNGFPLLTIFAKALSWMSDWVLNMPVASIREPRVLNILQ